MAATMHAYEQGTYMIFNIVETANTETAEVAQIQIEKSLFNQAVETASTETAQLETTSDFVVDFAKTETTSSVFSNGAATQNFSTLDLTATEETTVFGNGATSVFDQ
ncbi:MAG: hypothetical protein NWS71_06075 [Opitutales bacterium]|jgi:hypothetical protein|nr:hypothetical protein [Opitutales bacterium]